MEINKLYNIDFEIGYDMIDDGVVDLIVTDPPYRTISGGKGKKGDGSPTGILSENDGKIFKENNIDFDIFWRESYRVLKDNAHMYVMTNLLNLNDFISSAEKAGFKLHNLLVWKKNNVTPNRWYMKNAEYVLFLRKGKAFKINKQGSKTVHEFKNTTKRIHPTEKPVELMKLYIENSSNEGDLVLDPFSGSSSTLIGCIELNRNYIGFELDSEYYDKSIDRIKSHKS